MNLCTSFSWIKHERRTWEVIDVSRTDLYQKNKWTYCTIMPDIKALIWYLFHINILQQLHIYPALICKSVEWSWNHPHFLFYTRKITKIIQYPTLETVELLDECFNPSKLPHFQRRVFMTAVNVPAIIWLPHPTWINDSLCHCSEQTMNCKWPAFHYIVTICNSMAISHNWLADKFNELCSNSANAGRYDNMYLG